MRCKWLLCLAAIIAATTAIVEARRIILRQLTADEVYRVLKAAKREDAVPEGRIISQGIAAISGFGLGLAKGIGGSILYDVVTSNATMQWLNSLNLTSLHSGGNNGSGGGGKPRITQEICFGTTADNSESEPEARQATSTATEADWPATTTMTTNPTAAAVSPITTREAATGDTGTTGTNAGNTETQTGTMTRTGTGGGQTCIVIQKPKARKRRSIRRKRF